MALTKRIINTQNSGHFSPLLFAPEYYIIILIYLNYFIIGKNKMLAIKFTYIHFNDRPLKPLQCGVDRCRWCSGLRVLA